ncbi:hypothetical protein D7030_01360 [Flavobacteriaceae bacterium AU392]|nr:hypothetical protein D1817_07815 [Flavobacteriaceae bacterium]RKM86527.1 hypothetical protein D7030_01360 [Flavobacteriaceae bacterium AU392]
MRIDTKHGRFYVNLPSKLFNKIEEIAQAYEDIDLGMLGLLLHFIITGKFNDKNLENGAEWVALNSEILRKYDYLEFKTKTHLEVMVKEKILDFKDYYITRTRSRKKSKSRTYKIKDVYFEKVSIPYCFSSPKLVGKVSKYHTQRRVIAEYRCEHLTKWLQHDGFTINTVKAKAYVESKYVDKDDDYKREKRIQAIDNFDSYQTAYSREGKDDRLHSYFVRLPSDLKQFVRFEGQTLKEVDITSSQPFIFSYILDTIKQEYFIEIDRYKSISYRRFSNRLYKRFNSLINVYNDKDFMLDIRNICNSITIMLQESPKPIDFTEISSFISLIRSGKIYEFVGEELLKKGSIFFIKDKFWVRLFDKEINRTILYDFETLRDCAKKVTINALYGSPNHKGVKAIEHFKELFPEVAVFLSAMKSNDKADLPILMQRIESKCVLDCFAKKISKKHPKMLLISRHDSLITTEDNFEIMNKEFEILLNDYFKIKVKLGEEAWAD